MEYYWNTFAEWFMSLGDEYGVNPIIFGSIYLGAVPFFWACVYWLVRNLRLSKSIAGPVVAMTCCMISAYVYLMFAGHNVPWWVYAIVAGLILYAFYATWQKVREKMLEVEQEKSKVTTDS